jgi:hypothetical protein
MTCYIAFFKLAELILVLGMPPQQWYSGVFARHLIQSAACASLCFWPYMVSQRCGSDDIPSTAVIESRLPVIDSKAAGHRSTYTQSCSLFGGRGHILSKLTMHYVVHMVTLLYCFFEYEAPLLTMHVLLYLSGLLMHRSSMLNLQHRSRPLTIA